jgi:hypothetical protein
MVRRCSARQGRRPTSPSYIARFTHRFRRKSLRLALLRAVEEGDLLRCALSDSGAIWAAISGSA